MSNTTLKTVNAIAYHDGEKGLRYVTALALKQGVFAPKFDIAYSVEFGNALRFATKALAGAIASELAKQSSSGRDYHVVTITVTA